MALAEIQVKMYGSKIFYFYAHLLNEYAKKEKEEEKNKTTDTPTFHRVLLSKKVSIHLVLVLLTKWL